MNKKDMQIAKSIGKLVKRGGAYEVRCARCGSGISAHAAMPKSQAAKDLKSLGWNDEPDGLWRCTCVHEKPKPRTAIDALINKACGL